MRPGGMCVIVCLCAGAQPALGATYYVDAARGWDENAGTDASLPWRTIAKVNASRFSPGDSVLLRRGAMWREQLRPPTSGTAAAPVRFGAYGDGARPVINGADVVSTWTREGAGALWYATLQGPPAAVYRATVRLVPVIRLAELTKPTTMWWDGARARLYLWSSGGRSPQADGVEVVGAGRPRGVQVDNRQFITVEDMELRHIANRGVDWWTGAGVRNAGLTVRRCAIQVEDTRGSTGVYVNVGRGGMAAQLVVTDNVITPFPKGLQRWGVNVVANATGFEIAQNRIGPAGEDGVVVEDSSDGRIAGNTFAANGENCIDVKDSSRVIIAGNTCAGPDREYNVVVHDDSAKPVPTNLTYAITIEDNHLSRGGQNGYNAASIALFYVNGGVVRYNDIRDSYGSGILVKDGEAAGNANQVYYNVIVNRGTGSGAGVVVDQSADTHVYNNTVYDLRPGGSGVIVTGTVYTEGVEVKNNILWAGGGGGDALRVAKSATRGFTSDNNVLFANGNPTFEWRGIRLGGLRAWHRTTREDTHSRFANPMFVNAAADQLRLQAGSPGIDAGAWVGLARDRAGNPVPSGRGVDVGAFEGTP